MAATRISDLIIPSVFVPSVMERSLLANRFVTSGLITNNPTTAAKLRQGGLTFAVNSLKNIADNAGDPNVSNDDPTQSATPKKISARAQVGARLEFNDHFQAMDVTESVTGVDALAAVEADAANLIVNWRAKALGSILTGAVNETNTSGLVNTIALETTVGQGAANKFSAGALLDTATAWGDRFDPQSLYLVMNSRMWRALMAAEPNNFIPASKTDINIQSYMGMPVLVDDRIADRAGTTSGNVATMYLVQRGAIEFATAPVQVPVETSRLPLVGMGGGASIVSIRDAFSFHIVGTKWVGSAAATHPSFAELATAGNWARVYDEKAIGVAALVFNY